MERKGMENFPRTGSGNFLQLSDCIRVRTNNNLVRKRTLNHLAELAKWLSFPSH